MEESSFMRQLRLTKRIPSRGIGYNGLGKEFSTICESHTDLT